jgi:hypothetical protein
MVTDRFAAPYAQLKDGLQAVPTTAAAIPVSGAALKFNAWLEQVVVSATTAGTLTLTDGNSKSIVVAIAASAANVISFPRPVRFIGGVTWVASVAGMTAEVKGYYI